METNNTKTMRQSKTRTTTESALLIALATILGMFAVFKLPNGGSVTIGSMIPIMLISMKYPFGWSLLSAFAYSLIQMMSGFYAPPVENLLYYSLMIALDYVVAFSVLCLAGPLLRAFNKVMPERMAMLFAVVFCFALRFLCHFASGIIIWGVYAPPGQAVWLYSLLYNGTYMLGEAIVSGAILLVAGPQLLKILRSGNN
ncbi:MAG: energy-coupled thiamine transporter ThiT [Oscillospiraceae bacterium]|nr:energy-coupled thiamine transporter ThiT [Oscillospiraceae bacterium]